MAKRPSVQPPDSLQGDPTGGPYDVFHHTVSNMAPRLYACPSAPQIKGAFVHLITDDGEECWISGSIMIRPRRVKDR